MRLDGLGDSAGAGADTWPCLVGRAERFVSQYSELAEGATTTEDGSRSIVVRASPVGPRDFGSKL